MPIIELKGLNGLKGLSPQERASWKEEQIATGKLTKNSRWRDMDRLYRNQQFFDKYGEDAFNTYNKDQRDAIYRAGILGETAQSVYSPFTEELDSFGNKKVDPSKGVGDPYLYSQIMSMTPDGLEELMTSGWKTPTELKEELEKKRKERNDYLQNIKSPSAFVPSSNADVLGIEDISDKASSQKNQDLLDKIIAKDLKKQESLHSGDIQSLYDSKYTSMKDEDVKNQFFNDITRSDTNLGNGQFAAFYDKNGNPDSEMKDFSIDDMREYLARKEVLDAKLGPIASAKALENYAREYIHDHQGFFTKAGLLINDIGISTLTYTMDKVNSLRQVYNALEDVAYGNVSVYTDNEGNVIDPSNVKYDGNMFYYEANGKKIPVKQEEMSRTALDMLGKDENGRTRDALFNNQFLSDAEQYGTLNWEEQARYKNIGVSGMKVVYNPGESDILYESAKMMSFALADAASAVLPIGIGAVGKLGMAAKGASMAAKAGRVTGTTAYYGSKALRAAMPTVSAAAIGHAYGRGVFGEALMGNMQKLEEQTYNKAQQTFIGNYDTDSEFKSQVDKEVQSVYNNLKREQEAQLKDSGNVILDKDANDKALMSQARQEVMRRHAKRINDELKNSDEYYDAVNEAAESASHSAGVASVTDAAKYTFVNNFGYRSYLFNSPATRTANAFKRLKNSVVDENGKLVFKSAIDGKKLKTLGKIAGSQALGGAWTNFTDEMQSAGGRRINEDRFGAYLSGMYDGEAANSTYSAMDAVASYFSGARESLAEANTWKAGLVGALGSLMSIGPNVQGISTAFLTNSGKEAWRNASFGEKVNMIVSNGILSEYYARKAADERLKNAVDHVNNIIEQFDNFTPIRDAVALDLASMDVTNEADAKTVDFLKAVKAVSLLHQFDDDPSIKEHKGFMDRLKGRFAETPDEVLVGRSSGILQEALSTINNLTNGELTQEQTEDLLSNYYAKNQSEARTEENDKLALARMQERALELKEAENLWNEGNERISSYEEQQGKTIQPIVKNKILERWTLNNFLEKQLDEYENLISGSSYASRENQIESYGTEKARNRQVKAYEKTSKDLLKRIEEARKEAEEAKEMLDDFVEEKGESRSQEDIAVGQALLKEKMNKELQLQYLQETKDKVDSNIKRLSNPSEGEERVLSKEEILRLNPEDRARMLNPENFEDYSKEQQAEIEALIKELTAKDPAILDKVQDMANLARHKDANLSAYYMMITNPEAASVQLEAESDAAILKANSLRLRRSSELINNIIRKMEEAPSSNEDELREIIYRNLRELSPTILDHLSTIDVNEEGLENIPKYAAEIERAKDWSKLNSDIQGAIRTMGLEENQAKILSDNIDSLIKGATSRDEAIQILQDVIKSDRVSDSDKSNFTKLLESIGAISSQRDATTTETKEDKQKRDERIQTEQKDHEKTISNAEKEAQIEVQSKEAAAQVANEQRDNERAAQQQQQITEGKAVDESRIETPEERAKRKIVEMQETGLTEEEWEEVNKQSVLSDEDIIAGLKNAEDVQWIDSPTIEEQAADTNSAETPVIIQELTPDITDEGNNVPADTKDLIGNLWHPLDTEVLNNEAREVRRVGNMGKDDKLNAILGWLDTAGVKIAEIIDNELNEIIKVNPKIEIMYINATRNNTTNDQAMGDVPLLVVEYNDKVRRIHKDERGGVFNAGDKQYLVVGTLGFGKGNNGAKYREARDRHRPNRISYFKANPSERFWVVPNEYTEIQQMTAGRLVRQALNDSGVETRSITQLLEDQQRNPKGLQLEDLKWGIQYDQKFATVGVSERNTVYPPRDASSNVGSVFLLVEAANGNYIPAYIMPTMLSDIKDGKLKQQVNTLLYDMLSPNHSERVAAVKKLSQLLHLNKDKDTILVGKEDSPTISTSRNGVILRTFNLKDASFNSADFFRAIEELNPRINITTTALADPTIVRMLAEAGALNTDIAKIGTSNADYTLYNIGTDGKPIKESTVPNNMAPSLSVNSDLAISSQKFEHSVPMSGKTYREINGKWYDSNYKEVTDSKVVKQLNDNKFIRLNNLSPDMTNAYGEYYVLNADPNNPVVLLRNAKTFSTRTLDRNEATSALESINKYNIQQARKKLASQIEQSLEQGEDILEINEEAGLVSPNIEEEAEVEEETDATLKAQEIVDNIVLDSYDLQLSESGETYIDSSGKEYARVTSVISATEEAERMDKDNPWVLPSTTIGTGIDEFVRDFFADNLGNRETLTERYPNVNKEALNSFVRQLEELRQSFKDKGLTVVPRDIVVTGTIEITNQGKKYNLNVAGTLDLLAYDKEGNFYIFDMKTNRSAPDHKKGLKWSKQLSLYKQFLEEKYGVTVKGTEIIPIQVSYPAPKGWRNSNNDYTARNGQVYINGSPFHDTNPTLHNNIPIPTREVKVHFDLLTPTEQGLLTPIVDGTISSTTGTEVKTEVAARTPTENINETGSKSLAELQSRVGDAESYVSASEILVDRRFRRRMLDTLREKGYTGKTTTEAMQFLESINMPTTNISDIEAWLDMLTNCR